jgi:hypothetical protein
MEPSLTRPPLGRRIALEFHTAQPVTWIGPAWATICGAVASGEFLFSGQSLLRLAIAIILTDPILGAWRAAWVNTDWRRPMQIWRATPTRSWMLLPYARLDSPAAHLSQWLSSRAKFWREAVWPEVGQSISGIFISGLIALSVALVLGTSTFLLTILALLFAPLEGELQQNGVGRWPRALVEIGAAWWIGHAAVSVTLPTTESALLGLFFAFTYRGLLAMPSSREIGFAISNFSQVVIAGILTARGAFLHAGFVGVGIVAQALWQSLARRANQDAPTYLRHVQWFVLAAMIVAAIGVSH